MPNRDKPTKQYGIEELVEEQAGGDPFILFAAWFEQARKSGMEEPNAMALATAGLSGAPSLRMVLLKKFSDDGFVFFSNYTSAKGKELAANPAAALLFYWCDIEKQVRVSGTVSKISAAASDEYFASRPRGSQIAAAVSAQSDPVQNRGSLEKAWLDFERSHATGAIKRPANWGGYLLVPREFEFWQGRENRLHDRLVYSREGRNWSVRRLAP